MLPDLGNNVAELQREDPSPIVGYGQVCMPPVKVDGRWEVTITCCNGYGIPYMGTVTGIAANVASAITKRYCRKGPFMIAFAVDASEETYTSKLTGERFRLLKGKVGHARCCSHRIGPQIAWNV
ncbi:hypothetical protein [Caenispirillum salinarum]|uniref:hypothetical protein n=1 Tax=Caenispirillum salinarum TaxID=859058 RepID=UPI0038505E02